MKKVSLILLFTFALLASGCRKDPEGGETGGKTEPEKPVTPPPAPQVVIPEHHFLMGSLLGMEGGVRKGNTSASDGSESTTYYNKALFEAHDFQCDDSDWWDDIVEEYEYAGLDYIMPNCRGRLPRAATDKRYFTDHGDPAQIMKLLDAMKRRGTENLKIAIFDDAPASWAAARNLDLYNSYVPTMGNTAADAYPIDDLDAFYKYVWDYNIKLAFENFYGENAENGKYLLRIDGKPLLVIWSPNGFVNVEYGGVRPDCTGHLKAVLDKIHQDFLETFGEEVHICVDRAFSDRDNTVNKQVTNSMNSWFNTDPNSSHFARSMHTMNNFTVGVAVPGFSVNDKKGNRMFIDADHGKRLISSLRDMINYKADLVILEGFSDVLENAAYWRSTDTKFYDFPNQRLNILRKYSSTNAYPDVLRVEAEACDYYKDNTNGNSGLQYRKGNLDVKRCVDGFKGWCVTGTEAGEWLQWEELPYKEGTSSVVLRYSSTAEAKVRMDIDGKEGEEVTLPSTSGKWAEMEIASPSFEYSAWHKTVLNFISGSPDVNCFYIKIK